VGTPECDPILELISDVLADWIIDSVSVATRCLLCGHQPKSGPGRLIVEVSKPHTHPTHTTHTHTHTTPHTHHTHTHTPHHTTHTPHTHTHHTTHTPHTHTPHTHTHTHTQPVGHLWTSDQPVAETSTYTTNTRDGHPYPPRDSNPRSQQSISCRHTP